MANRLTTAYAGHGDTAEANIGAVLDNFLPPKLGMVYIPSRVPRIQQGLKKVVTWLEGEVGKNGTIPVADLVEALVERRDREGDEDDPGHDEVVLVMVFDPENEEDVELAKAAIAAGIRVVDLSAAGDDLLLADAEISFEEEAVEDTPVDDAEPETPPFDVDDKPAEAAPSPAAAVASARDAGIAAALAAEQVAAEARSAALAATAALPGVAVQFTINFDPPAINALADAIVAAMGRQAQAQLVQSVPTPEVVPVGVTGGNKDDAAGQPKGTKVYYYNAGLDKYRPARGTAKEGEQRVFLTDAEIATIKERNQLL